MVCSFVLAMPSVAEGAAQGWNVFYWLFESSPMPGFLSALLSGHWRTDGLDEHLWSVLGLIGGAVVAAPIAGWMVKVLPVRALTWLVGALVTGLAVWQGAVLLLTA